MKKAERSAKKKEKKGQERRIPKNAAKKKSRTKYVNFCSNKARPLVKLK